MGSEMCIRDSPTAGSSWTPGSQDTSPGRNAAPLEHALALAISEAAKAGQWAIVAQLGRELEARRLTHLPNVVTLARSPSRK